MQPSGQLEPGPLSLHWTSAGPGCKGWQWADSCVAGSGTQMSACHHQGQHPDVASCFAHFITSFQYHFQVSLAIRWWGHWDAHGAWPWHSLLALQAAFNSVAATAQPLPTPLPGSAVHQPLRERASPSGPSVTCLPSAACLVRPAGPSVCVHLPSAVWSVCEPAVPAFAFLPR